MFKMNEYYKQFELFGVSNSFTKRQSNMLEKSIEHVFFTDIFSRIKEEDFKVLYSDKKSRPNVPVNQLVGALILKHLYNWTYSELFKNLNFNILTRYAIGLHSIDEQVFSEASIYNFQNKVINHYVNTGTDLLTEVFEGLTSKQLKEFEVNTTIQRGDSFLMGSNIIDYTRLQLIIEVLLRLYKTVSDTDKEKYCSVLTPYLSQSSSQYIYRLKKELLPKELEQLGIIYNQLHLALQNDYQDTLAFINFERVYQDHFVITEDKVQVIASNELHSGILMSPDDPSATYRKKREKFSKGYNGHLSETAHPDNKINFITDQVVVPNNTDDAKTLEERLPVMLDKSPDLKEYHCDGGYGSPNVDKFLEDNHIKQIQNTIRGKRAHVKMEIREDENGDFWVHCQQGQEIKSEKTSIGKNGQNYKAIFDESICRTCLLAARCNTQKFKAKKKPRRALYFSQEKVRLHRRQQNIDSIPKERRKLRANVEATVKEVKRGIKDGKVRVRGISKASIYMSMTCIAVNLTRIHKFYHKNGLMTHFYRFFDKLISFIGLPNNNFTGYTKNTEINTKRTDFEIFCF